ncbi:hypothetical protein K461DRAFT_296504 [Myriangium duriaei CBS 260.36]|uniref:RING-type domain-containing protein n=1 Tax=Myriangium duriaei CBS 260.36 TaxID=1168546 RepID=A0A9P4J0G1_9PEZI|nr:hypothetical protein K461DRAFT_296504 [Myriangium duriaei CBS 260.36]
MSHSKRNTASALFTSHERTLLRTTWGTQTTHLTRDSLLPFGACRLCLLSARDPVSCATSGHLFCRECAVANLLAQKKELRRAEKAWERDEAARKLREEELDEQRRGKEQADFEAVQAGRAPEKRKRGADVAGGDADWAAAKRARKEGGDGRVSSSFWVPGEQEAEEKERVARPKGKGSVCPAGGEHEMSLKTMVEVKFSEEQGSTADNPLRTCPACKKGLSNATRAVLVRPCGHVLCKACGDKFLTPPERHAHDSRRRGSEDDVVLCYVCSGPASERSKPTRGEDEEGKKRKKNKESLGPGIVEVSVEGTGFAGGGKNQVKKAGLAYQC